MTRTTQRSAHGFDDDPQDTGAGAIDEEIDDTETDAGEAEHSESGELATIPFVGGDAYDAFYEGGVATPGVKPEVPETSTEDAVRLYLKSIGRVPLLTK